MLDNSLLSNATRECTENSSQGEYGQPREEILKMQIHQNPKCIQIGNYYSCFPHFYRAPEASTSLKDSILRLNDLSTSALMPNYNSLNDYGLFTIDKNTAYAKLLGVKFNHRFAKVNYRLWVGKDVAVIHRFCQIGKSLSPGLVYRFHAYRKLIDIALTNNEGHLVPAILFFGMGINQLKAGLGNLLWKTLCNNSLSRNHWIFVNAYQFGKCRSTKGVSLYSNTIFRKPRLLKNSSVIFKPIIELLAQLPTSILISKILHTRLEYSRIDNDLEADFFLKIFLWISKHAKSQKKLTDNNFIDRLWHTVKDTHRMAQRLNDRFSLEWSYRRMQQEHTRLSLDLEELIYPNYRAEYKFAEPWVRLIEHNGIMASLLTTPHSLAVEGSEMHHCVASYHEYVYNGHSIIFSLKDQDNERSTLQLGHQENKVVILQHRGKYNADVSTVLNAMAQHVVDIQNALLANKRLNTYSTLTAAIVE